MTRRVMYIKHLRLPPTEWARLKKLLRPLFKGNGIERCEVGFNGCDNFFITYAHSKKRKDFENKNEWVEVVLSCRKCHQTLDAMIPDEMTKLVRTIIRDRGFEILYNDGEPAAHTKEW